MTPGWVAVCSGRRPLASHPWCPPSPCLANPLPHYSPYPSPWEVVPTGSRAQREGVGFTPGRPSNAEPLSPQLQVPASMAFVTDSNRPQPLPQPPPTASKPYLTASGAASEAPSRPMCPCVALTLDSPGTSVGQRDGGRC